MIDVRDPPRHDPACAEPRQVAPLLPACQRSCACRGSWILLKTHGFLPPELEARKEWLRLEALLAACADPGERAEHARDARQAWLRYRLLLEQSSGGQGWTDYRDELLLRLGR